MTCSILVRTWWKDLTWAQWCLAAIERFAHGFDEVVVILPRSSASRLRQIDLGGANVRLELCADVADDYLGQQVSKLHADSFTDADFVCHVDADFIFARPVGPDDLVPRGRPSVLTREAALMGRHWPWGSCSADFLGWPVAFDAMQRPPFVFPRWLYPEVRSFCRRMHGVAIDEYVLSRPSRGFSEFTVLANFAYRYHRDAFEWIDVEAAPVLDWGRWYWSWEGLSGDTVAELQRLLGSSEGA